MTRKYNGQKKRGKNTNNGSHNTTEKFEQYETPLKKTGICSGRETIHAFMLHFRHRLKNNNNLLIYNMC